jgi:regulatory protein
MSAIKGKYSLIEAKPKIESWCVYRERAHSEVKGKLYDFGLSKEDVEALIAHLISEGYLNEQRFAEAFASGKHRIKKWGRSKITIHLKQKQVSDFCIKKGLLSIDNEEYLLNLKHLAEKRWAMLKGVGWQKKAKLTQYLITRGYEYDLINEVIEGF